MALETSDLETVKPQWRARLEDALSVSTRGKRKLLLLSSTISLVVVILGVLPTKIESLGITFETREQSNLLLLLAAVNAYAFFGFWLYAWGDFHLQLRSQRSAATGYIDVFTRGKATRLESLNYFSRFAFDFLVPLGYGAFAIWKLYLALK